MVAEETELASQIGGERFEVSERSQVAPKGTVHGVELDHGVGVVDRISILRRLRITRVSLAMRSCCFGVRLVTQTGSKPWNASRMPSHFASTTRQLIPAEQQLR